MVEASDNPQHRPWRISWELRALGGLGSGNRKRWCDCTLAHGSTDLRLDAKPLLEPRSSSLQGLREGWNSNAPSRCRRQEGRPVHRHQHVPSRTILSHLRPAGNLRDYLSRNRRSVGSRNDYSRLEVGFQPDKGSSLDRVQVLQPLPSHRVSRDGPRLSNSTLENRLQPSDLAQEILEDDPTMRMLVIRPFRMELEAVDRSRSVDHRLDLGSR